MALGGLCLTIAPPVGIVLSLIGLARRQSPGLALAGLVVNGGVFAVCFLFPLLASLCN